MNSALEMGLYDAMLVEKLVHDLLLMLVENSIGCLDFIQDVMLFYLQLDEAQAEELAADDLAPGETRGHKRGRRGTAITKLMRAIDNFKRYGSASEPP